MPADKKEAAPAAPSSKAPAFKRGDEVYLKEEAPTKTRESRKARGHTVADYKPSAFTVTNNPQPGDALFLELEGKGHGAKQTRVCEPGDVVPAKG